MTVPSTGSNLLHKNSLLSEIEQTFFQKKLKITLTHRPLIMIIALTGKAGYLMIYMTHYVLRIVNK